MNRFIIKGGAFFLVLAAIYLVLGFLADGKTDPFYLRFTSPKQKSLILGTSRAAQGIIPTILNKKVVANKYEGPFYNFSFTVLHSPFGEVYYNAIKNKIDTNTKNGLFIIAVNPWSIASKTDSKNLRESELELSKIKFFNSYPNYDYLKNAYKNSFFNLLKEKTFNNKSIMFLHDDGWLEVTMNISDKLIEKGSEEKLKNYKNKQLPFYKISNYRINYLKKTIHLLKEYGDIILVRIPVDNRMLEIENLLDKEFENRIHKIAKQNSCKYISYKDDGYIYPDGNHLYKESGKKFTERLAIDINKLYSK